jgi:formylglycine-generating enzyme required for sulfatase activity
MDLSQIEMARYLNLSDNDRQEVVRSITSLTGKRFAAGSDARGVFAIDHVTNARFRLIPGGVYRIGLSLDEELAARRISDPLPATVDEMRPVVTVSLRPLLMSETVITCGQARDFVAHVSEGPGTGPALLTKEEANTMAQRVGCRLPLEKEWESACRAGAESLFVWGDALPDENELERWMSWDLTEPAQLPANRVGLVGLYFGEWCADEFRLNHAPGSPIEEGSNVIRGGGAFFWPWQDEEWVWCMSAMRMPSSALPPGGKCAARLVFDFG